MARLKDLTRNVSNMSEEELLEHVKQVRHNKYVAKPAVAKRVADVEKKEKNTQVRGVNKIIDSMTPEQKLALLKQLEEGTDSEG